jgi:uncharacterized membrane protein
MLQMNFHLTTSSSSSDDGSMKKYFLTGLATLLPVAVTIYVVVFVVGFLTLPFMGTVTNLLHRLQIYVPFNSETVIRATAQIIILIALFLFIILLGLVARWFFIKSLIKISDKILHKIPLINKVYKTSKEITQILFASNKNSFKQVVMVHFPDQESYCLGLIAREAPEICAVDGCSDMVSVFLPTTPNPMTGFMILSPKKDLLFLDMKSEDAIKYIVSCGVVQPRSAVRS